MKSSHKKIPWYEIVFNVCVLLLLTESLILDKPIVFSRLCIPIMIFCSFYILRDKWNGHDDKSILKIRQH